MSTLVLTLNSSVMTVNGPDDVLQGQKLRLTSKESLKDLETAIHAAAGSRRCGVREGIPVTRKASSTLISLDLRDEIDNVPGNSEVGSSPSRGHQEQSQRPMSQAKAMCSEDQIESLSETEGKADAQKVQNADVFQINRVPGNVIEKSDQNVRRNLPYQLRSLSSKTKPPAQFTNTQESLMFHRRKPGQKVYTSHSKAAVDWDEDLRQSSDNHDGTTNQHSEKEERSSGKSFLQEEKEDKPKTPQEGCQDKAEREADDAEWSSDDDAQTGHSGSKSEENHDPLTNHDQRHMERGGLNTAQYTLATLKATDAHNMTELIKDSTGSDKGAEIAVEENVGVGNATDKTPHEEHKDSLPTNEYGPGGRGKAVGRKLTAAFKDFDTQGNEGSFEQRYPKVGTHNTEVTVLEHDGMRMKPVQLVFQGQGKGNESGYDGGSETDATEEAPERDGQVSSSPLCCHSPAHPLLERAAAPAGTLEGLDIDQVVQTDSKSTCELLETAHKRTQSMLLASSQRLACQLEDEKKAVNRVLEAYQRQCHQVLDELFKTQEERIRLCEQQAESIRTHHARICQGLINRLEANGRMAHKRTLPDLPASQKDAAMDHD
ncbi:hypothetical protein HFD88_009529 [Aspergillus terreus]|nr:hypothetical protein HFD88_009529 [Aspergillus terreus]